MPAKLPRTAIVNKSAANAVTRVFDNNGIVFARDPSDCRHIARLSRIIHRHNRLSVLEPVCFEYDRIEIVRNRVYVGEVRRCAHECRAIGRCEKRIWRRDYTVTRSNGRNSHGEMQGGGGAVHPNRMLGPNKLSKAPFEFFNLRPGCEPIGTQAPRQQL